MIELNQREMKSLSRILTMIFCFAPFAYANAAGPVATTSGSNLTSFNPSNVNNNQWATISNGRYDGNTSAKADFGNCNSIVLRCASPKCNNGGCSDMSVASSIVAGCVKSNDSCKKYGDDLIQYMSAQLVANSNAKINEQQLAAQQAAAQAQAAAAAAANEQSQQQMAAMQQQMQQMQYQMQQQQAESAAQLQEALAAQAAQSAAALDNMKSAATAAAMENEAGISAYQQDAINRGISADILQRKQIAGQVMTEIEDAEVSLKNAKTAMQTSFEYAHCDNRGSNCEGPKRVKKWRELALQFVEPYNNSIDKIYDALVVAQSVGGIDLSDIYMMLNNSCNSWGQYMCPKMSGGTIIYTNSSEGQKGTPYVCNNKEDSAYSRCVYGCDNLNNGYYGGKYSSSSECKRKECMTMCEQCTLLKPLTDKEEVYQGWIDAEGDTDKGNVTVVACASGALDNSTFFASRSRRKNGANLVDIDQMETWLNQSEPKYKSVRNSENINETINKYCAVNEETRTKLEAAVNGKVAPAKGSILCIEELGKTKEDKTECPYIHPTYAICDTHPYNAGKDNMSNTTADTKNCTSDQIENCTKYNKTNCNEIVWAETNSSGACITKYCKPGYKVGNNYCVSYTNCSSADIYQAKDDSSNKQAICYEKEKFDEYNNYMNEYSGVNEVKEIIALKTTVISQQMYKEYEYLNATIRRLKTQLEKATLNATLQAAGAKSDEGSSSGLLGASSKNSQFADCAGKDMQEMIYCLRQNYSALSNQINNKKCNAAIKKQLAYDIDLIKRQIPDKKDYVQIKDCITEDSIKDCKACLQTTYNTGINTLEDVKLDREARRSGRYRDD